MDPATLVPLLGFAGTVVVAGSAVVAAIVTHRSETERTSESTLEKTLNQRILLKDEQNADLKNDLIQCLERGRRKDNENRNLRKEIMELRAQLRSQEEP